MKKLMLVIIALFVMVAFTGCDDASIAAHNISQDADMFRVERRIVFYNSITDSYILEMQGFCSINADSLDNQLEVTCKIGPEEYQKHYLGLSDNVTYLVEQLDTSDVSVYRYQLIFKPDVMLPTFTTSDAPR